MTSSEKFAIQSMAMDLKRVSLGVHNNSFRMAERFLKEAKKREQEISGCFFPSYINKILKKICKLKIKRNIKIAEDVMMYSTLLQNFSLN